MNYYAINKKQEDRDRLKSGLITAIIWSLLLLFVFAYTVTENFPENKEAVTTMLVNFGDNRNGNGLEEPAEQEGSFAAQSNTNLATLSQPVSQNKVTEIAETKAEIKDKIITGNNTHTAIKSATKTDKSTSKTGSKTSAAKTSNTKNKTDKSSNNKGSGDGKGNAAIGNLIKGRGSKNGSQGNGGDAGNAGDPLGGEGNGDSKIGVDRKLIGFIPGTMGRGGSQPSHQCSASGSITIAYTVDKAGNVISAKRAGGISDGCVTSTSITWVKRYVKAEKATVSSTGTYKITF